LDVAAQMTLTFVGEKEGDSIGGGSGRLVVQKQGWGRGFEGVIGVGGLRVRKVVDCGVGVGGMGATNFNGKTISQLKSWLTEHGVELPPDTKRKNFYVELAEETEAELEKQARSGGGKAAKAAVARTPAAAAKTPAGATRTSTRTPARAPARQVVSPPPSLSPGGNRSREGVPDTPPPRRRRTDADLVVASKGGTAARAAVAVVLFAVILYGLKVAGALPPSLAGLM